MLNLIFLRPKFLTVKLNHWTWPLVLVSMRINKSYSFYPTLIAASKLPLSKLLSKSSSSPVLIVGFIPLNKRIPFLDLKLAWNFLKYAAMWVKLFDMMASCLKRYSWFISCWSLKLLAYRLPSLFNNYLGKLLFPCVCCRMKLARRWAHQLRVSQS